VSWVRLSLGLFRRQALSDVVGGLPLQVIAQFILQVPIHLLAAEERAEA
jgi:hypothetical protein